MPGEHGDAPLPANAIKSEQEVARGLITHLKGLKDSYLKGRNTDPTKSEFDVASSLDLEPLLGEIEASRQIRGNVIESALRSAGGDSIVRFAMFARVLQHRNEYESSQTPESHSTLLRDIQLGQALAMDEDFSNPAFTTAASIFDEIKVQYWESKPPSPATVSTTGVLPSRAPRFAAPVPPPSEPDLAPPTASEPPTQTEREIIKASYDLLRGRHQDHLQNPVAFLNTLDEIYQLGGIDIPDVVDTIRDITNTSDTYKNQVHQAQQARIDDVTDLINADGIDPQNPDSIDVMRINAQDIEGLESQIRIANLIGFDQDPVLAEGLGNIAAWIEQIKTERAARGPLPPTAAQLTPPVEPEGDEEEEVDDYQSYEQLRAEAGRLKGEQLDNTPSLKLINLIDDRAMRVDQIVDRAVLPEVAQIIEQSLDRYLVDPDSLESDFTVSLLRNSVPYSHIPALVMGINAEALNILLKYKQVKRNTTLANIYLPNSGDQIQASRGFFGGAPSQDKIEAAEADRSRYSALRKFQTEALSLYTEGMGEPSVVLAIFEKEAKGEESLTKREGAILDKDDQEVTQTVIERIRNHLSLDDWIVVITETEKMRAAQKDLPNELFEEIQAKIVDSDKRNDLVHAFGSLTNARRGIRTLVYTDITGAYLGIPTEERDQLLQSLDEEGNLSREAILAINQAIIDGDLETARRMSSFAQAFNRKDHPLAGFSTALDKAYKDTEAGEISEREVDLDLDPLYAQARDYVLERTDEGISDIELLQNELGISYERAEKLVLEIHQDEIDALEEGNPSSYLLRQAETDNDEADYDQIIDQIEGKDTEEGES